MKLIMTKGLPGSGKSHWAYKYLEENPNTVLVCKDDLRAMMFNSAWTGNREKVILKVRDFIIQTGLESGRNVVVHDTNFAPKHEVRLKQLADQHKAEFEVKDFTDIPIEQCIHNDLCREESVGEKVIREMYRDWLKPKPPVLENDPTLPDAVVCDIDGTLALFGSANPYERDFSKDKVNEPIANLIDRYCNDGITILLVSGRKDINKNQTEKWLIEKSIPHKKLFMRKTGDVRKDYIIKKELYEAEIKNKYNVLFVIDDRNQVVEMWRGEGLTCLQVADGDF